MCMYSVQACSERTANSKPNAVTPKALGILRKSGHSSIYLLATGGPCRHGLCAQSTSFVMQQSLTREFIVQWSPVISTVAAFLSQALWWCRQFAVHLNSNNSTVRLVKENGFHVILAAALFKICKQGNWEDIISTAESQGGGGGTFIGCGTPGFSMIMQLRTLWISTAGLEILIIAQSWALQPHIQYMSS